ncbi:cytochrome P450 family protein [Tieghemostelium lacteum]|uniref:Cytochrome P450 family protein n=1 Tax=Tieghemostelium lacteum TaxID=361077 RepID=A0A152A2S6_TIELA|nr:cytochrome P450 family protein [Tieghemostelium lacteum]|eukprot:KYR00509.1 cytochrome P450 family protein [Tieghemostelium lacteum]
MYTLIIVLIVLYLIYNFIHKNSKRYKNEVTGPIAFPVIGNLHLFFSKKRHPHQILTDLTKKYGLVYRFYMGHIYSLVVTDPDLIREIFVKNFDNFTDRLHLPSIKYVGGNYKGVVMADEYYWKINKAKIISSFSNSNLKKVSHILEKTASDLLNVMNEYCSDQGGNKGNWAPRLYCQKYTMNIVLRYIFNLEIPYEENVNGRVSELIDSINSILQILKSGGAGDYISFLSPFYDFYLTHFQKDMPKINKFIEEIVMEHIQTIDKENPRDLIDSLILQYDVTKQESINDISCFGRELFMAGTESTANSLIWFILIMANNPNVQEKIYGELKSVSNQKSISDSEYLKLTLKDRNSTPYLNASIKESMRYKNIGPLGIPRACKKDIVINDIFIPAGCQVFQNFHGLSHIDQFWNEPYQFLPERFLNNSHSDVFIPFSVGPRNCLGLSLAQDEMYLACANVMLNYKISPPDGVETLDESEIFGIAIHPHHFEVKLEKRQ